jgi:hypothetical protein
MSTANLCRGMIPIWVPFIRLLLICLRIIIILICLKILWSITSINQRNWYLLMVLSHINTVRVIRRLSNFTGKGRPHWGAFLWIISGTNRPEQSHWHSKASWISSHMKGSKVPVGIWTHSGEGQVVWSQ